jgi:uncharacterized membrane protein
VQATDPPASAENRKRITEARAPDRLRGAAMSAVTDPAALRPLRTLTWVVYALYAASFMLGITALAAIIINYIKRPAVVGTVYASHFAWQIRTFWIGLAGMVLAIVTMAILIGWLVAAATVVWAIYRLVVGALKLMADQPIAEGKYGLAADHA